MKIERMEEKKQEALAKVMSKSFSYLRTLILDDDAINDENTANLMCNVYMKGIVTLLSLHNKDITKALEALKLVNEGMIILLNKQLKDE